MTVVGKKKKIPETIEISRIFRGDPAGIRTPDTLLKRQVLCLLSYWGRLAGTAGFEPTISESKSGVLPLHYIPLSILFYSSIPASAGMLSICGVGYGTRTHGIRNHNPALYQLS